MKTISLHDLIIELKKKKINLGFDPKATVSMYSEMGIIPGKSLKLIQRYSTLGPICIKIMDSFIMIRKENADKIIILKEPNE